VDEPLALIPIAFFSTEDTNIIPAATLINWGPLSSRALLLKLDYERVSSTSSD
jgi:hypothetical protein